MVVKLWDIILCVFVIYVLLIIFINIIRYCYWSCFGNVNGVYNKLKLGLEIINLVILLIKMFEFVLELILLVWLNFGFNVLVVFIFSCN